MDTLDSFGEWQRQRRAALGLTRPELAACAGCSVSALRKIEADERRPSRQLAELLAACLRIAPEDQPAFVEAARGLRRVARLAAPRPSAAFSATDNLPASLTPLIGRTAELATVARLLGDAHCRLLTLVGPGGIGKTRLALEVARTQQQAFADGVFFIPLAAIGSPEHMVPAIAHVLGLSFSGPGDPRTHLLYHLSNKRMLLVLDNLEHLLAGTELLVEVLARAPELKLLATSRERLALQGEWVLEVEGLPVPESDAVEGIEAYSAVALFLQRARRTSPAFKPAAEDWSAIARICRLLEGMPLAIELAVGWLPVLTCAEIAREVEQSLDFLTTTMRDVPERHRTLRGLFAHSWRLLTEEEQGAGARLAVFRGGFTREAAQVVAGAELPTLRALIDKSHLYASRQNRYEMHELLRQYGEEKLEATGEAEAVRRAHAHYYLQAVGARQGDLAGGNQLRALAEIEADLGNARAAWQWALDAKAEALLVDTIRSLHLFFNLLSRYHEEITLFQATAARFAPAHGAPPGKVWRMVTPYLAYTAAVAGMATAVLRRDLELCLHLARAAAEPLQEADCLLALAFYQMFVERDARGAIRWGEESVERFRSLNDHTGLCWSLIWLSFFHEQDGRPSLAQACGEEGLLVAQRMGNQVGIPFVLNRFAATALCTGAYATAGSYYRQALEMALEMKHWQTVAGAQTGLAVVHCLRGELEQAQALAQECLRSARKINFPLSKSSALAAWKLCRGLSGTPPLAEEGEDETMPNTGTALFNVIAHWAAALHACAEDEAVAWEEVRRALAVAQGSRYPALITWLLPVAALLLACRGERQRATELVALASTHPLSPTGWVERWAPLAEARERLETELGHEPFAAAWRRGEAAELEAVAGALLADAPQLAEPEAGGAN